MTGFRVVQCRQDSVLPPDWMAATGRLLSDAVAQGAALGWVDPPTVGETTVLLSEVRHQATTGDASLLVAVSAADVIVGAGYWRRYARPTHLPHADLERLVVDRDHRRCGIGRALATGLIASARRAGIEQLTLDARGDQMAALGLYRDLGFEEYGRLRDFVAVADLRFDKTFWVLDLRTE